MWTILLIILLLNLIISKKQTNILYCGIFAWTGDSTKKFSWDKFNMLGILNDVRGGDSCGRAVGGDVIIGTGKQKEYLDLIKTYKNTPLKEPIVIGHARKASFGYKVDELNGQPIVIEEDGEVVFVLAHNGTIYNTEELLELYPTTINDIRTDSYILAYIIYEHGFDVLEHYQGTASLVMYDRRKFLESGDTVMYLFRGESRASYNATRMIEERPLHIYTRKNKSIYISSEEYPLYAIDGDLDSIDEVEANGVYEIINGELSTIYEINRDKEDMGQWRKTRVTPKTRNNNNSRNHYNDYEEAYYEDYLDTGNGFASGMDNNFIGGGAAAGTELYAQYNVQMDEEIILEKDVKAKVLHYSKGRYYIGSVIANGIIHVTPDRKYHLGSQIPKDAKPFYFLDGIMIQDHIAFREANKRYKKLTKLEKNGLVGMNILTEYSKFPVWVKIGAMGGLKKWNHSTKHIDHYSGKFCPHFGKRHYTVNRGIIQSYKILNSEKDIWLPDILSTNDVDNSIESPLKIVKGFIKDSADTQSIKKIIVKQTIANELGELLEKITSVKEHVAILGEEYFEVGTTISNLEEIEKIFTDPENQLFDKKLNLKKSWEDS